MKRDGYYIVSIILLVVIIYILWTRWQNASALADSRQTIIEEKEAKIKYITTESGRIVAEKQAAELRANDMERAYPQLAADLKNEFDIKIKEVKAMVRAEFAAHGSGNSTVNHYHYTDSLGNKTSSWRLRANDGYLDFQAEVYDSLNAPYEYTYIDTISTVVHTKKKWLFGKERLYASVQLKNPNAKVTNTTNVLIKDHRDKRIVISVGGSYTPFSNEFFPAIHVGYALVKF